MRSEIAACLLAMPLWLAGQTCSTPVVGNPDGNYVVPGSMGDIVYKPGLALDAYAPAGPPRPAALVIRGRNGNRRGYVTNVYEQLTQDGYAWFAPSFHTAEDVAAALDYIRCRGRFNISSRVVLIGDDTGAAMALRLAMKGGIAGVVMLAAKLDEGLPKPDIPVLMIHGTADQETPPTQAQAFCAALKHCTYYAEQGASHGFESWFPGQWDYKEELDAWLRNDRRGLWKNISYARPGGRDLAMDAFVPRGAGPFPAVIVVHGGGYARDKVTYIAPIFEPLAKANFAWFSIDYPSLEFTHRAEQLDALRDAIRYVRRHAARYHVDGNQIAIMGESFSAAMVTIVASKPCAGCEVQAVLSFYGGYQTAPPANDAARARLDALYGKGLWTAETLRENSPWDLAHRGMTPVLVVQGTGENGFERSKEYHEHLKQLGVRTDLLLVEGAPHGIENWEEHAEWAFYKQRVVDWLKDTLRP